MSKSTKNHSRRNAPNYFGDNIQNYVCTHCTMENLWIEEIAKNKPFFSQVFCKKMFFYVKIRILQKISRCYASSKISTLHWTVKKNKKKKFGGLRRTVNANMWLVEWRFIAMTLPSVAKNRLVQYWRSSYVHRECFW